MNSFIQFYYSTTEHLFLDPVIWKFTGKPEVIVYVTPIIAVFFTVKVKLQKIFFKTSWQGSLFYKIQLRIHVKVKKITVFYILLLTAN